MPKQPTPTKRPEPADPVRRPDSDPPDQPSQDPVIEPSYDPPGRPMQDPVQPGNDQPRMRAMVRSICEDVAPGTARSRDRFSAMHAAAFIVLSLLLASTPASAAPLPPEVESAGEEEEPRGDRWKDRWQGRRHWLHDDDDVARDAATDGHAANARANCRNVRVRFKKPDGSTAVRRINRCK